MTPRKRRAAPLNPLLHRAEEDDDEDDEDDEDEEDEDDDEDDVVVSRAAATLRSALT